MQTTIMDGVIIPNSMLCYDTSLLATTTTPPLPAVLKAVRPPDGVSHESTTKADAEFHQGLIQTAPSCIDLQIQVDRYGLTEMEELQVSYVQALPEDMLADVLRCLAPRSLAVCRCVCKA